jgi:hypothetical protein
MEEGGVPCLISRGQLLVHSQNWEDTGSHHIIRFWICAKLLNYSSFVKGERKLRNELVRWNMIPESKILTLFLSPFCGIQSRWSLITSVESIIDACSLPSNTTHYFFKFLCYRLRTQHGRVSRVFRIQGLVLGSILSNLCDFARPTSPFLNFFPHLENEEKKCLVTMLLGH